MEKNKKKLLIVGIPIAAAVLALVGTVGWVGYKKRIVGVRNNEITQPILQAQQEIEFIQGHQQENAVSYHGQKATSGLGRFTIVIPQGWTGLLRPSDSDWLLMKEGMKQPAYHAGKQVVITDVSGFGSDGPSVFTVLIHDNMAAPEGAPSDFSIPNNGQPIQGTKYAVKYTDTLEGLGGHEKGQRMYTYWFNLKDGNHLIVVYNVYAQDMQDQINLVDEVVRSIILKN